MAEAITFTGQKKLSTVQREFTAQFPYLGLGFFTQEEYEKTARGEPARPADTDVTIATARTRNDGEDISLHGKWLTGNFEDEFAKRYGLHVQVAIRAKDGSGARYTGENLDKLTLRGLNDKAAEAGFPKFEY